MSYRPLLYSNRNISSEKYFEFEGGATLPLFWVTLLNEEVINKLKPKLEYVEKLSEGEYEIFNESDESIPYFELEIGIENFRRNTEKGIDYIYKLYPDYLPLYKDFIKFISPENKDNFILINIFDFFQASNNADETIQFLLESIQPIQQNKLYCEHYKNLIFIVGYYEKEFALYSKTYNNWIIKTEKQWKEEQHIWEKKQRTIKYKVQNFIQKQLPLITTILAGASLAFFFILVGKEKNHEVKTFILLPLSLCMFYISYKITK
ncbi:hypothetical protein [Apibacter sp. wkB309]|uniref:hypothetical protein n=1 Tax=Apibacter sp. wkB309 TaxID=1679467 RepID=UPI000CF89DBE|nr:hypothetical protein [Apibacter sp. wkB309]PQL93013.1 hypothetical protein C4S75_01685 [Apibacter sp. wkB309]